MADDVAPSEMLAWEPELVALVAKGANGFSTLALKSILEEVGAAAGPEAIAEKALEDYCGTEACEVCKETVDTLIAVGIPQEIAEKAKLTAAQRRALPAATFAIPEKRPGPGSYPVNDKRHARNALSRVSQHGSSEEKRRVRAKVHRKYPTIGDAEKDDEEEDDNGDDDSEKALPEALRRNMKRMTRRQRRRMKKRDNKTKKSFSLPNDGIPTPRDNGHAGSSDKADDTPKHHTMDQSGMGTPQTKRCPTCKGVGYLDPDKPGIACPTCNGKAFVETDRGLTTTAPRPVSVAKDTSEKTMSIGVMPAPGTPAWEHVDAVSLADVARLLTECETAVDGMQLRERIEALAGRGEDWADSMDLECASSAVQHALGIVARLAFHEMAEATKGIALPEQARKTLSRLLRESNRTQEPSSKEVLTVDITPDEFAKMTRKTVKEAFKAEAKKAKAAEKKRAKKAQADTTTTSVTRTDRIPRGEPDHDVESEVESHSVDGGPGVQQAAGRGSGKKKSSMKALLKEQGEQLAQLNGSIARFGNRPRQGGLVLDGQPRGSFIPVDAGGTSTPGGNVVALSKALDEEHDPARRELLGAQLTKAALAEGHKRGLI